MTNLILATDSYKLTHWAQYPEGTEKVYSYFESREGARYPNTVFFGLQYLIEHFLMQPVSHTDIVEADKIAKAHFGRDLFNKEGWEYIVDYHRGHLPLKIMAVPEGLPVPTGNVLMTVENTDPKCWWLTNHVESILTHVWYPSTVATLSRSVKEIVAGYLARTGDSLDGLPFMLHDFGYRGASGHESAALGGAAHLINFKGTDTLPAMQLAIQTYHADLESLAFSVPATEHSVMTSLGREGELDQFKRAIALNPTGVLSVVSDSYNIYEKVKAVGGALKDEIMTRDGVFVVRPDSTTREHPTPSELIGWILNSLWNDFGGTENSKGFKVLDSHVRVLWGDGLSPDQIDKILGRAQIEGFSAENLVFGMGGGLLQKGIDRDTQRFAFKCSAQERNGEWVDIYKDPIDSSKKSKRGRFLDAGLETVFDNGYLVRRQDFANVRKNAELKVLTIV